MPSKSRSLTPIERRNRFQAFAAKTPDGKVFSLHQLCRIPEYRVWEGMLDRCGHRGKRHPHPNYAGRGIEVCDEWRRSFETFIFDMGARPSSQHSIERIDNNKGYSPDNCKWATRAEQSINKTTTRWVEFEGKRWALSELAKSRGMTPSCLRQRLQNGWSLERSVTEPVQRARHSKDDRPRPLFRSSLTKPVIR